MFMCVYVARVIIVLHPTGSSWASANQRRHLVSPRSAAASLPRKDVNVAPIAANAVPIVARSSHGPILWYGTHLNGSTFFARGGVCFRHARMETDWERGPTYNPTWIIETVDVGIQRKGDGSVVPCGARGDCPSNRVRRCGPNVSVHSSCLFRIPKQTFSLLMAGFKRETCIFCNMCFAPIFDISEPPPISLSFSPFGSFILLPSHIPWKKKFSLYQRPSLYEYFGICVLSFPTFTLLPPPPGTLLWLRNNNTLFITRHTRPGFSLTNLRFIGLKGKKKKILEKGGEGREERKHLSPRLRELGPYALRHGWRTYERWEMESEDNGERARGRG